MMQSPEEYSRICDEALKSVDGIKLDTVQPRNIVFAGMGGSGISGNLMKDVLGQTVKIPIEISKSYDLPTHVGPDTLFICTSYSGNTEETLTQFVEALKRKCPTVTITSGGKLMEWSQKFNVPSIKLPTGFPPRDSLPYQFFSLAACLQKLGVNDFSKDIEEFMGVLPKIDLSQMDAISEEMKDTIPLIYGSSEFSGVSLRIKSQLNENSKMVAKFEELPELNHNEVVGFELSSYPNLSVIFLRDKKERAEISQRMQITKEIIDDKVNGMHEIWSYGESKLARVMSLVYQGDYLTVKLAQIKGINREQNKTIDKVKNDLKVLGTVEKLERELSFIS